MAFSGSVAGVDENRKVTALLDGGNDREVERVAGKIGKRADAAFAKHDVVIAFGQDVFGSHQEFVESSGHAALQQDWFFRAAGALEQGEILHVARADLNDIGVFFHEVERFVVDGLGDDAIAKFVAHLGQNFQARFAESLKTIRGGAWFVGAAAEEAYTRGLEL